MKQEKLDEIVNALKGLEHYEWKKVRDEVDSEYSEAVRKVEYEAKRKYDRTLREVKLSLNGIDRFKSEISWMVEGYDFTTGVIRKQEGEGE